MENLISKSFLEALSEELPKDIHEEKHIVSENMQKYGGSFVKALGAAIIFADIHNLRKIKSAFSNYWDQYLDFKG